MCRGVIAYFFYMFIVSCLYATSKTYKYDIAEVVIHKNDTVLPISTQQLKHAILIAEIITMQKEIHNSKSIIHLAIEQNKESDKNLSTKSQEYKHLLLQGFIANKTQHINTQFGTLLLQQKIGTNDSYMQIPSNMPLQSAILISHNKRFYIVGFDNIYENSIETLNLKDSKTSNIIQDVNYEISPWRYFLVLGVMFAILIMLYVIRLRQHRGKESSNIVLEQARILDSKNKVALIRYGEKRYLIGVNPNGITLLDTLQCDNKVEQMQNESIQKDAKPQSFMQLFLKRQ